MRRFLQLGFLCIGILYGLLFYHIRYYCLEFKFFHHPFYGQFVQELKSALHQRGYFMNCPIFFPKTIIYFNQTNETMLKPQITDNSAYTKHIIFNGDCSEDIDFEYFKQYDAVLNSDEYLNAYLAFYNLPTAHFPLREDNKKQCQTTYKTEEIDIKAIAKRLDTLIQGITHE